MHGAAIKTQFHPQNAPPFDWPHRVMWHAKGRGGGGGGVQEQSVYLEKQNMKIENIQPGPIRLACYVFSPYFSILSFILFSLLLDFFFLSSVSFSGFLRLLYLYLFSSALPWRWLQSAAPLNFTALLSGSPSSPHSSCGPGLSPSSYFFLRFPVFRTALNQL
jgi:hypothetical protein